MKHLILLSAASLLALSMAACSSDEGKANGKGIVVTNWNEGGASYARGDSDAVSDAIPESRENFEERRNEATGESFESIQSLDERSDSGVQATATTKIDVR